MGKDKGSMVTLLMVAGGGLAIYWYITNYGPNGAVSAGAVSYWNTWFGTAATTATPTVAAPTTGTTMIPVQTTVPVAPTVPFATTPPPPATSVPPGAVGVVIPSGFTVVADINNSLKGTIQYNGGALTLNVIPGNAGASSGVLWNGAGADVTNQFTPAQVSQITQAFISAGQAQGLSGIVPVPWHQTATNLSGLSGMSFKGKGFGGGFRKPLVN